MTMRHEAIYALYNNVVTISGDGANTVAKDVNGNVVSWDATAVGNKETELLNALKLDMLRAERNQRLADTDHYGLSDQTMTNAMSTYRQDLRDITDSATSLDDVTWPTKP
tara:strand:- start:474 stop:803 length:330 start_codon:yes stop_codon:yes gene_type:complete